MPRPTKIFAGMRHGNLTVVRELSERRNGRVFFECKCDCGAVAHIRSSHFYPTRRYCSRKCDLLSNQRVVDLTGKIFGRLSVVEPVGIDDKTGWMRWSCICSCGTKHVAAGAQLSAGETRSCGCLVGEAQRDGRTKEQIREQQRERCRLNARNNPARIKANKIKYETKRAQATPPWLTQDHWSEMNALYEKARHLTRETGVRHEVDHMAPIQGKVFSGLHVPWNLQILTQVENVSKSNRYADLLGDQEKCRIKSQHDNT